MQGSSSPAERQGRSNYLALYIIVGFVAAHLATYALVVALSNRPVWAVPDSLSGRFVVDVLTRWQAWVGGVIGAWFGYKVGTA